MLQIVAFGKIKPDFGQILTGPNTIESFSVFKTVVIGPSNQASNGCSLGFH